MLATRYKALIITEFAEMRGSKRTSPNQVGMARCGVIGAQPIDGGYDATRREIVHQWDVIQEDILRLTYVHYNMVFVGKNWILKGRGFGSKMIMLK